MSNYSGQVKSNRVWKVLVFDINRVCLRILKKMLQICNYHVTTCNNAKEAKSILQDQNNNFDFVMIDVYMQDMNGLEFVKHVSEQIDLPVIAMSADDEEDVIKDVFKSGACDYLIKPIRVENVRHLWKNVYRAQRHGSMKRVEQSWSDSVTNLVNDQSNNNSVDYQKISNNNKSIISDGEDRKCLKKRKIINTNVGYNQQVNDDYASTSRKKQRIVWTSELHHKFVQAVNQFGNSSMFLVSFFSLFLRQLIYSVKS
ncbi:hypothetical protein RND81_01G128300 [Saponaria officinalis]|uniref:Response regulatory domain-containing protein n=1 Tax=Saponaria officinalis TaxID=3572 RepID=A0AAW1N9P0_SAPOF